MHLQPKVWHQDPAPGNDELLTQLPFKNQTFKYGIYLYPKPWYMFI